MIVFRLALLIGLELSASGVVRASMLFWDGNTTTTGGGLTWSRPTILSDPPTQLAVVGGGQGYVAEEFTVGTSGSYSFSVAQNGVGIGQWDGVNGNILGFLYQNSFTPTSPLTNVIEDGGASSSWSHNLVAGTDYWIVVTGYCGTGNGPGTGSIAGCSGPSTLEEGPFAASLTGPGTITPLGEEGDNVPEPSSFALVLGAGVLLWTLRRRRQAFSAVPVLISGKISKTLSTTR
jgi:hypothetical protein